MEIPVNLLQKAVDQISQLPGIGKKTALRLALHLLKQPQIQSEELANSIINLRLNAIYCKECHAISDDMVCNICNHPKRDKSVICVVEDIRDVMAIENTNMFKGVYHVLGGKISPLDGVGPSQLKINSLIEKVKNNKVTEIIFALSSTMEGDTTNFYIYKQIKDYEIKLSTIARGIAVGDELEYTDEVTLGRSLINRIPFQLNL